MEPKLNKLSNLCNIKPAGDKQQVFVSIELKI